jgi:hypothetical protein
MQQNLEQTLSLLLFVFLPLLRHCAQMPADLMMHQAETLNHATLQNITA